MQTYKYNSLWGIYSFLVVIFLVYMLLEADFGRKAFTTALGIIIICTVIIYRTLRPFVEIGEEVIIIYSLAGKETFQLRNIDVYEFEDCNIIKLHERESNIKSDVDLSFLKHDDIESIKLALQNSIGEIKRISSYN